MTSQKLIITMTSHTGGGGEVRQALDHPHPGLLVVVHPSVHHGADRQQGEAPPSGWNLRRRFGVGGGGRRRR